MVSIPSDHPLAPSDAILDRVIDRIDIPSLPLKDALQVFATQAAIKIIVPPVLSRTDDQLRTPVEAHFRNVALANALEAVLNQVSPTADYGVSGNSLTIDDPGDMELGCMTSERLRRMSRLPRWATTGNEQMKPSLPSSRTPLPHITGAIAAELAAEERRSITGTAFWSSNKRYADIGNWRGFCWISSKRPLEATSGRGPQPVRSEAITKAAHLPCLTLSGKMVPSPIQDDQP